MGDRVNNMFSALRFLTDSSYSNFSIPKVVYNHHQHMNNGKKCMKWKPLSCCQAPLLR